MSPIPQRGSWGSGEVERYEIRGSPTPEEESLILRALETMLREERLARRPSAWKLTGRALATRNGILGYRTRLSGTGWTHSSALPWAGRQANGRHGRGDAK